MRGRGLARPGAGQTLSGWEGFRWDEILNLTWRDVLWQKKRLAVTAKDGWTITLMLRLTRGHGHGLPP